MTEQILDGVSTMPAFLWLLIGFTILSAAFMGLIYRNLNKLLQEIETKQARLRRDEKTLNKKIAQHKREVREHHLRRKERR